MSSSEKCDLSHSESKCIIWYIGLIFICYVLFSVLRSLWRGLYSCFIADLIGANVDWKKLGRWAVVTGSTDGLGKEYAKTLASKGFNIVLISRNPEKLEDVAQEIEKKYSVQTKTVSVDITGEPTIYDKIRKEIEGLDIGVLVNNVGMSYPYPEYLTKIPNPEKLCDDIIKANAVSCSRMTILVMPIMERLGKGVIINISSLSALSPIPLLSFYSASKVYVNFLTQAFQDEYKKKGIIIQLVLPGFVATKMSKLRPSLTTCTPEAFVRWAIKTVGVESETCGYPIHKLQGYFQDLLSRFLPGTLFITITHNMMNKMRLRYYKKYGLDDGKLLKEK